MKTLLKIIAVYLLLCCFFSACGNRPENLPAEVSNISNSENVQTAINVNQNANTETAQKPKVPNLQAELLDERNKTTNSPLGNFDFKNFSFELPRGWQDSDGKEAVLENGIRRMTEEPKKIGLAYVTTKFMDVNDDGQDEAVVILKITTGGSAIPQIVYIYEWKDEKPEQIWFFRTGDRADGGLKDLRVENGALVVEIFGQDRYILGEGETRKILGDEEQICCPTHFTRTFYKWNGKSFPMQGKRLTFSMSDKNAPPQENVIETLEKENGAKK